MTMFRFCIPNCDFPGCGEDAPIAAWTATEARRQAKECGWRFYKGKDYCPTHAPVANLAEKVEATCHDDESQRATARSNCR